MALRALGFGAADDIRFRISNWRVTSVPRGNTRVFLITMDNNETLGWGYILIICDRHITVLNRKIKFTDIWNSLKFEKIYGSTYKFLDIYIFFFYD